ncbi:MtnX-like HAD-IB family phosphatase [bacterium]|nr:MtnX-like HAD-IB family phosphatase [bacterium]QQR57519.1 MAG: MtnX-like HAD-IB family phosphatase [Candidatus Melainabacteria bacterium]
MKQQFDRVQIFCDFDGTITKGDTVDLLLEKLALEEWKEIEALWVAGKINGRECMSRQIPLIRGGWDAIEKVLATVELDKGFGAFVAWCRFRHIPFSIVSDGLDIVINTLLKRENVRVDKIWSNRLIENEFGSLRIEFPERAHRVVCQTGRCKCQVLDMAPKGDLKVVIGDGRSDYCWAQNADVLFAKDSLSRHCKSEGINFHSYESMLEVRMALEELIPVMVPSQFSTPQQTQMPVVDHFYEGAWVTA